jgi:hypothetical protein
MALRIARTVGQTKRTPLSRSPSREMRLLEAQAQLRIAQGARLADE